MLPAVQARGEGLTLSVGGGLGGIGAVPDFGGLWAYWCFAVGCSWVWLCSGFCLDEHCVRRCE